MRKWLPLIAVCLGTFMLLVDVTIVNVALPAMAVDLHTSLSALQWVVDGYALALAALLIGVGGVADRVGHRRTYLAGLVLFALASLACGLAPGPVPLVVARLIQGVGGAAMISTTFALLNASYDGRDRGVAYGMWGAVAGASSAVGPLAGGPLTEFLSWRWIFFVNLPVSAVAIAMALLVLRDSDVRHARRVDVAGIAVFSAAIGLLTFGMIRAGEVGWGAPGSWGVLLAGAALLVAFVVVESRVAEPLLEPALLRNRIFSGVLVTAVLLNFAAYVSFAYTSIWMQSVLQLSPVTAGLVGLPMSVAAFAVSAAMGRVITQLRASRVIGTGILLIGLGDLLGFLLVHELRSWPALLPGFLIVGLGVGMATSPLNSTGMAAVPAQRGGMAGGAVNTARQIGYAFGIALLGSVFTAGAHRTLTGRHVDSSATAARTIAGGQSGELVRAAPAPMRGAVLDAVHAAAVSGIGLVLVVAGAVGVLGAALAYTMIRSGRRADAPATKSVSVRTSVESVSG